MKLLALIIIFSITTVCAEATPADTAVCSSISRSYVDISTSPADPVWKVTPAVSDSPNYRSKAWRDSVTLYQGRLEQYHQSYYSYDWGMTFAMLPVAGEWYVDKLYTGVGFSAARTLAVAASVVGAVRWIGGYRNTGLNIGLVVGGIAGYVLLKLLEISDVMHTVSQRNEGLAEDLHIAIPDLTPGSIRYPTRSWPDWVTKKPEARQPERARDAVDLPLPAPR